MQAVCAKCSRLMCRAVVLFLVAECAQTTPMIAPLPGDPNFSIDGSVAFFKSGESNPTQPNPPRPLCHRELLEGGCGVLGVCDGRVVEVEEVDGGLAGGGPGLWRLVPSALAPSGRGTGARGVFASWWALG